MKNNAPTFLTTDVFHANYNCKSKIIINQGGTGSSKTYSILQVIILKCLTMLKKNEICTVTGQDMPNLKRGALRDFINIWNSCDFFKNAIVRYNKSTQEFTLKNGAIIEFVSFTNEQDAKGAKRKMLYINEADGMFSEIAAQLIMRTNIQVYIDYNPNKPFWVHGDDYLANKRLAGDISSFISNFRNNKYLDPKIVEHIKTYKHTNPNKWRVYGLGLMGVAEGVIFDNIRRCAEMPIADNYVYGLDFGFTNDPSALVQVCFYGGELWIDEVFYEYGMKNSAIIKRMQEEEIPKNATVVADCADPKSIDEIASAGFYVVPCVKGPDSVLYGISKMSEYRINITSRSKNLLAEIDTYTWKKDRRTGNYLNVPIDEKNHAIDATRYTLKQIFKPNKIIFS